jgi:general secretion pathway protein K
MPRAAAFSRKPNAGSVIVLVMVTVLLASFLLTRFVQRAGTELLADARASDQARLRREAYSALEVTLAVLADVRAIDNGLQSPAQGWDRPLDYAGYTPENVGSVEVTYEDESGKLSLPRADLATLEALLELLGLGPAEAEKAGDSLLVWTQANYAPVDLDADGSNYERSALPHNPAARPMRSFAELASIENVRDYFLDDYGQPNERAQAFAANVSLYSFNQVNLNAATPVVMAAGGLVPAQIDALQAYNRQQAASGGPGYFRGISDVTGALGGNASLQGFGTEVRALRINITVRDGTNTFRLSTVIAPPGGATVATAPSQGASSSAAGSPAATSASTSAPLTETAVPDVKKLDYPFKVLEIREDVETPAPPPPADSL